ncbi:TPA: hypothetical protein DD449_04220 [Candidatus Berkelbacteria bacterium]|uniref:Uncharacterized protein n=1 Tax=Berkelbacteria bacterium GW2011_GWE1_39_12 TaxID=1618337 RepID=A0A0G4B3Z2_9BACT|nr:MAG: hypothetical protein UT28_C0001G0465 [Berkelbacteria bacterium GW2011_GWE1_39_12]HBO60860.1 hypothetical protein [Candidatus Berkelbacteria bacterium]
MPTKINKSYIIIGIILIALLIAAIILTIWRNNVNKVALINNPNNEKVFFPKLLQDNQSIYYYSNTSNSIKKWDLKKNSIETIVKLSFKDTNNIIYSPDLSMALIKTENPSNAADHHTFLINLDTKQEVKKLSDNILNVSWSPDSKKIAYHYLDWNLDDADWIATSNPDGNSESIITDIEYENAQIGWADNKNLVYYNIPSETFKAIIYLLSTETKKQIEIADQYYLGDITNILTNKFLIDGTTSESANPGLSLLDTKSKKITGLLPASSVDKAVYSAKNNSVYTASRPYGNSDLFQIINLDTNKPSKLKIRSSDDISATNLMVTSDSKTLYFTSGNNLYKKVL